MKPLPSLTESQQAAGVDRVGDNIALRSGAGCGKTLVLARRFTELLIRGADLENPLRRFVALTFTDKAALEMSQRVRLMLRSFAAGAKGDDRRRLRDWLEQLPEARISTIHSFCASLLRGCAIEAGLGPDFAVCAEQAVTDRLLAGAVEEAILTAVEQEDHAAVELLGQMSFDSLADLLARLISQRANCDLHAYGDAEATFNRWAGQLVSGRRDAQQRLKNDGQIRRLLEELSAIDCRDPEDKLLEHRNAAVDSARGILEIPLEDAAGLFDGLAVIKPGNCGSDKNWGGGEKDSARRVRHKIKALLAALGEYSLYAENLDDQDRAAAETIAGITSLAVRANELYRNEKRTGGIVDFTDLIALSRDLLKGDERLRNSLAEGIDQLLIDEAQDTDAAQIELLLSLLGPADKGKNSEKSFAPPEGKLFLVGDAKQSIYRFRGAQVEAFEALCERLGGEGQILLDQSFRTHAGGVAFINELFTALMGDDYSPISSERSEQPDRPAVEILLAGGTEEKPIDTAARATAAQAALTAQRIEEMLGGDEKLVWDRREEQWRPPRAGDIAILFSRMTNSLPYERQLQLRGIPYYVLGGSGFFKQQEIFDVLNALRVIDNPFDDISLFGALRGAMFGLDDNTLMHIAETHHSPFLPGLDPARLAGKISEAQLRILRFACGLLRSLGRQKDAMGIDELIRLLLGETGYEATLLGGFQGRRQAGNVRMLLDHAAAAGGQISLAEFIHQTNEQILDEERYEQAPVCGEDENVVRLLTIHKAKGLEFPVVFLPDLNAPGRGRGRTRRLLRRFDMGLTTDILPQSDGQDDQSRPLSIRLAEKREEDEQRRESLRKYYVAATRHQDHLVLIGADVRDKDGQFKNADSFLRKMDQAMGVTESLDSGREELSFGQGQFTARCRRVAPTPAARQPGQSRGGNILAQSAGPDDLHQAILKEAKKIQGTKKIQKNSPPTLLGPLDASTGRVELATTALGEFEHCPMCYHWQYELRAPIIELGAKSQIPNPKSEIDPLSLGTLLHRCMELLDFGSDQSAEALLRQAGKDTNIITGAETEALTGQLDAMLKKFRSTELFADLTSAGEVHRELDFTATFGPMTLRGQIDLLYRDAGGGWHIVDYKSDRIEADGDLQAKADRYELQMLVYALAVAARTGQPPAGASLYFMRTGQMHHIKITPQTLTSARQRIADLTEQLIKARRSKTFHRCEKPTCNFCRLEHLRHLG